MQGQSHQGKAVLEQYDARNKTFLAFKEGLGNSLGLIRPVKRSGVSLGFGNNRKETKKGK